MGIFPPPSAGPLSHFLSGHGAAWPREAGDGLCSQASPRSGGQTQTFLGQQSSALVCSRTPESEICNYVLLRLKTAGSYQVQVQPTAALINWPHLKMKQAAVVVLGLQRAPGKQAVPGREPWARTSSSFWTFSKSVTKYNSFRVVILLKGARLSHIPAGRPGMWPEVCLKDPCSPQRLLLLSSAPHLGGNPCQTPNPPKRTQTRGGGRGVPERSPARLLPPERWLDYLPGSLPGASPCCHKFQAIRAPSCASILLLGTLTRLAPQADVHATRLGSYFTTEDDLFIF